MPSYYYSLLGIVRTIKNKESEWIVEVCYKDETIYEGQYKEIHKWHSIGKYTDVEELNIIIQTLCSEEKKRSFG